jgi:hypothetical protein
MRPGIVAVGSHVLVNIMRNPRVAANCYEIR